MHHRNIVQAKYFKDVTLKALAKKGIFVIGVQAFKEFYENGAWGTGLAFCLDNGGCGQVRTHAEVIALAEAAN